MLLGQLRYFKSTYSTVKSFIMLVFSKMLLYTAISRYPILLHINNFIYFVFGQINKVDKIEWIDWITL